MARYTAAGAGRVEIEAHANHLLVPIPGLHKTTERRGRGSDAENVAAACWWKAKAPRGAAPLDNRPRFDAAAQSAF